MVSSLIFRFLNTIIQVNLQRCDHCLRLSLFAWTCGCVNGIPALLRPDRPMARPWRRTMDHARFPSETDNGAQRFFTAEAGKGEDADDDARLCGPVLEHFNQGSRACLQTRFLTDSSKSLWDDRPHPGPLLQRGRSGSRSFEESCDGIEATTAKNPPPRFP